MVSLGSLWLPILLSAVVVFIVSSIIHMVLKYHSRDFRPLPDEDAARAALGKQNLSPGLYIMPHCQDMKAMKDPEMIRKFEEGPVVILTVVPKGPMNMGKSLIRWFLFSLGISIVVAYLAGLALAPGTPYLIVFRITGTAAWLGYAGAVVFSGIWKGAPWSKVWVEVFDGLVYALATAGVFGALWPR